MAHQELSLGGLRVREMSERVPFEYALVADDLELDRGGIDGRHGYRKQGNTAASNNPGEIPSSTLKGATEFSFANGGGTVNYACLNGDVMTLYVDQYGGLGVTNFAAGIPVAKSAGIADPGTGFPSASNISTDGQIIPEPNIPSYALLRSLDSRNAQPTVIDAITGRRELLTVGGGSVAAGFSVKGDHPDLFYGGGGMLPTDAVTTNLTVSGANAGVALSATATLTFYDVLTGAGTTPILEVKLIWSFQNSETLLEKTRPKCRVEITNLTGSTINNVFFSFGLDPNPGITSGSTATQFLNAADPTALSVMGIVGDHYVALGSYTDGTIVGWTNTLAETGIARVVDTHIAGNPNFRQTGATAASYYNGAAFVSSSATFPTDTTWQGTLPTTSGNQALFLKSPVWNIGAGATQAYEFFLFTRDDINAAAGGDPQLLARYRPGTQTVTDARTVPVHAGNVYRATDPSSETAEDGTLTLVDTVFGAAAKVSGAQLGKHLYLGSDESGVAWQRMKPDYTLESITPLAKPTGTGTTVTPSVTLFSSLTETLSGLAKTANWNGSGWTLYSGSPTGSVTYTLGADQDYRGYEWLLVYVSCSARSRPGIYPITISLANNAGTEEQVVGTIVTNSRNDPSPSAIYVPLAGLSATLRAAVRKIKFQGSNANVPNTYFGTYGFIPIPIKPVLNPAVYYVSYYNSTTGTESPLSDKIEVNLNPFVLGNYPYIYGQVVNFYYNGNTATAQPDAQPTNVYNYRAESVLPGPSRTDLVPLPQISVPITVTAGAADKVRLWALTESPSGISAGSIRLVKSVDNPGTGTLAIVDDQGPRTLSQQPYKGTGTPPPCLALAAVGGRLVAGGNPSFPNRLYVSSFLPFGQQTDPFPSFPEIPVISADGHSFDLGDSAGETILALCCGDKALYLMTNFACYIMTDLSPFAPIGTGSPPFEISRKGVISRRGYVWFDKGLAWASHDSIYLARGRSSADSLTEENRTIYREWLLPDSTLLMFVQDSRLWAVRGQRYMRLDMSKTPWTWTRGTFAHTFRHPATWRDPTGTIEQAWALAQDGYLYRVQPGTGPGDANRATSDAGTAIPAWTYETGYDVAAQSARIKMVWLDISGAVTATAYRDATVNRPKTFSTAGQHELPIAADLRAYTFRLKLTGTNLIAVRRAMYERGPVKGAKGGGTAV